MKTKSVLHRTGFSLIELLISVAIVGILATLAMPKYSRYRARTIRSEGLLKISTIKGAMDSFYAQYGVYATCWGSMGVELQGGYFGIGTKAEIRNTGAFVTGDTIARGKGALCPEGISGALVLNERAFPITRWGSGCEALYSNVNYGYIQYNNSQSDLHFNLTSFWRPCTGALADFEWVAVTGSPSTGLKIYWQDWNGQGSSQDE